MEKRTLSLTLLKVGWNIPAEISCQLFSKSLKNSKSKLSPLDRFMSKNSQINATNGK